MKILKIAVIGAGAAGLCAARHIAFRTNMVPVVYEQSSTVGGAWFYTEETGFDKNGLKVHSAMYKNLKTNLPKEVMEFPDFPFDKKFPSFMTHEQVQEYLETYCDHFKLLKYIQLETVVKHVKPVSASYGNVWEVTVQDLKSKMSSTSIFDAVFVCNGHYAKPNIPDIRGRELFQGVMIHSHPYRHPEVFSGKKVVILGCGSSGQDISLDVAAHAKTVIIAHRTPRLISPLPKNVSQVSTVSEFHSDGKTIIFEDGSRTEADALVFCTGYQYDFPFLDPLCDINVDNERVQYLYKHVINPSHPTMAFIGICKKICPFPQFHFQVIYALSALDGSMKLPSKAEMLAEIQEEYQNRLKEGIPPRASHVMGVKQWEYNDKLADAAKVSRLNSRVEKLYKDVSKTRTEMLPHYKENEIKLLNDGMYELCITHRK